MLFAAPQRVFHACPLQRRGEYVRERLDEQHIRAAELARARAIRPQHAPGTFAALHDDTDAAQNVMLFDVGRDVEARFGGEVLDHDRRSGVQHIAGEASRVGGDYCERIALAHPLPPPLPRPNDQTAVLGPELEDLAEFDVETPSEQFRGGIKQVGTGGAGERLLPEPRNGLLLPRRRPELHLGPGRLFDAQPAKPLGSQDSLPLVGAVWKGAKARCDTALGP